MAYEKSRDPHLSASNSSPGRRLELITPGSALTLYAKALRVFSASGCTITVLAVDDQDGATQTLEYPAGLFIEPLSVREVTASTGSPTIHGYVK